MTTINRYVLSELTAERYQALLRAGPGQLQQRRGRRTEHHRRRPRTGRRGRGRAHRPVGQGPVPLDGIKVTEEEFATAEKELDPELGEALRTAIANIHEHHRAQLPQESWMHEVRPGVMAGERWTPIASVGSTYPRGKGSFRP